MAYSKLSSYIKTVKHPDLKSKHSLTACLKKTSNFFEKSFHLHGNFTYKRAIFRTPIYLEPEASSKACRTCKMIIHIQGPSISEQFIQAFSKIFRPIQGY